MEKSIWTSIFLAIASCTTEQSADTTSVYGNDDRVDVYQSTNQSLKQLSRSTVSLIKSDKINGLRVLGQNFGEKMNLCPNERFRDQTAAADCTGFLAAADLVVTAGHCIKTSEDCQKTKVVFDFAYNSGTTDPLVLQSDRIFQCASIIKTVSGGNDKLDFAVIKLDRSVVGRTPLKLRQTSSNMAIGTAVAMIGNSAGLPLKIAERGKVVAAGNPNFFEATLDSFGGNSGSPVFVGDEVSGIVVRGKQDFDISGDCTKLYTYSDNESTAEDVTRVETFRDLIGQIPNPTPRPTPTPDPDTDPGTTNLRVVAQAATLLSNAAEQFSTTAVNQRLVMLAQRLELAAGDLVSSASLSADTPWDREISEAVLTDYQTVTDSYMRLRIACENSGGPVDSQILQSIITFYEQIRREFE